MGFSKQTVLSTATNTNSHKGQQEGNRKKSIELNAKWRQKQKMRLLEIKKQWLWYTKVAEQKTDEWGSEYIQSISATLDFIQILCTNVW